MQGPHSAASAPGLAQAAWAWPDALGLALVLAFALLGAWRGLWWQAVRLIGVTGAVIAARALAPELEPAITGGFPTLAGRFAHGLAWLVCFLAGLSLAALLGLIGKTALETLQLGLVDRAGGLCAGALTGLLTHAAVLVVLAQLASEPWIHANVTGTRSGGLLRTLSQRWPLLLDEEAVALIGAALAPAPDSAAGAPKPAPKGAAPAGA